MDALHQSATVIRQPAYAEVCIDSLDRYRYGIAPSGPQVTTSSDWQSNLRHYALQGYFTRLVLTQLQFQWNLPTIIAGYNDILSFVVNPGPEEQPGTITILPGYYTPSGLATAIQNALQAEFTLDAFTCTFTNGSFVITNTAPFYIETLAAGYPSQAGDFLRAVRCLITTGFLNQGGNAAAATTLVGSPPTMLATRYIDMYSSYIAKFQDVKDTSTSQELIYNNIIARIYPVPGNWRFDITANSSPGSAPFIVNLDYATPKQIMWNPNEALGNFDIQLRDEHGQFVPFDLATGTYGCEYVMTVLASET